MTDTIPVAPPAPRPRWLAELRFCATLILLVLGLHSLVARPFYIPSASMMPNLQVGDRLIVSKYPYGWSWASVSFRPLPPMPGRLFGRLPERGDVVTLTPTDANHGGEDLIKRVIGLPGDTVAMVGGRLWLNGKPVTTRDLGERRLPVDGNFHCDDADPEPAQRFPWSAGARVPDAGGKAWCRLHVIRETLPGGASYDTIEAGFSVNDNFAAYVVPADHVFLMGDNRDNSADSRVPVALHGLGGAVPIENIGGRAEFVTFSLNGNPGWNPLNWFRGERFGASLRPARAP